LSVRRSGIKQLGTSWRVCLVVLMVVAWTPTLAAETRAADFTWSGEAAVGEPNWSNATNWGGTAPTGSVGTLTFPTLETSACPYEGGGSPTATCEKSNNDLNGLAANGLNFGCGNYEFSGNALTLGAGGVTTSCFEHGESRIGFPITLGAKQTWLIEGGFSENGMRVRLQADVNGPSEPLEIQLVNNSFLTLAPSGHVEVGPVTIDGTKSSREYFYGLDLEAGSLNGADGNEVSLVRALITGPGTVGPLASKGGIIRLPYNNLTVSGPMTLDSTTELVTNIEPVNHSQITVNGRVALGNAKLSVSGAQFSEFCPATGEKYILLTSSSSLSGTFAELPNGSTTKISDCAGGPGPAIEITYTSNQVIATAVGPATSPTATTSPASSVQQTTATLNGVVTPGATAVSECYFEYGETYNVYGSTVPCAQTVGGGTMPVPVSASLTGLTPGTTYHVRLVATSSGGTGYGSDEMFTTAGSSPPTVGTRIPFTGWPDVALLSGEINAHGNDVLYGFEYGRSYVEEHFTGWLGHVTSTSLTSVEYAQHGLQPDVRYYVRVVGFYQGTTFVRGATVSFEITPPEPEAAEAPYLEANGGDAEKGFVLRCNPGTWRNAAGFRYEWYGGSHLADTQEYSVTKSDIGHRVQCKITPYQLNGQADDAASLMSEPPYLPEGANDIIIPEWAKLGFSVGDAANLGAEAGGSVACVVLTDGACALLIGFDLERIVLTELIFSEVDPPDRNYRDIAVPGSQSLSTMRRYPCARGLPHTTCARLAHLAGRYAAAAARATSVIEAFAISRNRTLIARKKKNTQALLVQAAARKVYVGLLADSFVELNSAGPLYAEALHHARLDERIGAAASRRLANRPYTEVIGHSLLKRMLRFATRADIKKAVEAAGRHPAAFDLQKTLRRVLPTALLERYYATLDFNDLTSLVNGLENQRALSTTSGRGLLVDVAHARAACTQSSRKVAIEAFLRDAKSAIAASYYRLLVAAAQPLIDGGSTVDPYPHCLG